jgi:hypothetical protein
VLRPRARLPKPPRLIADTGYHRNRRQAGLASPPVLERDVSDTHLVPARARGLLGLRARSRLNGNFFRIGPGSAFI